MDRLQINRISQLNRYWYAIRFAGPRVPFLALARDLGNERRFAYWSPSSFEGKGGWIVERSTLMRYGSRFDNLELKLELADRQAERKRQGKVS